MGSGSAGSNETFLLSYTGDFPTTSRARGKARLPCHTWKQVLSQLAERGTLVWPLENVRQVKRAGTSFC